MYDNAMMFVFGMLTGGMIVLGVAMLTALLRAAGIGRGRR